MRLAVNRKIADVPAAATMPRRPAGLKLQHLNVIASIGRHRNAHRAAAELGVSQSAISKIIHKAEAIVGAPLFDRGLTRHASESLGRRHAGACHWRVE